MSPDLSFIKHIYLGASPSSAPGSGWALEQGGGGSGDPPALGSWNMHKKGAPAPQGTSPSPLTVVSLLCPPHCSVHKSLCLQGLSPEHRARQICVIQGQVWGVPLLLTLPQRQDLFTIYLYSMKWKTLLKSRTCFSLMTSIF